MGCCDRKKTKFLCLHYIVPIVLLILVLFSQGFTIVFGLHYKYRQVSNLRLARIQRHIDKINRHPVFTILSPDGDIIDCIHKKKQIAFDHPLLKNHKIQKEPSKWPKMKEEKKEEGENEGRKNEKEGWRTREIGGWEQMWHRNGTGCPKGTIPVRHSTVQDVLRAKSLYHFGKKPPPTSLPLDNIRHKSVDSPDVIAIGHEHAIAYTETSEKIYGAKATINIWDPSIEEANEFSLSQIWLLSGSFDGSDLNSIEAGWQVSPELYGDSRPRLFTYWTSDSYETTGCYNLLCSGFVQTNNRIAVGGAISPVSSFNGNQFDITLLIWKDPKFGNWWLSFGEDTIVGYWPGELFTHLEDHATIVEWGGEVVNSRVNGLHTSTQMGSGRFPQEGFSKASYFRNLEIVDSDNTLSPPQDIQTLAENSNCYDINSFYNSDWGHHFYYGGPGRNPNCP